MNILDFKILPDKPLNCFGSAYANNQFRVGQRIRCLNFGGLPMQGVLGTINQIGSFYHEVKLDKRYTFEGSTSLDTLLLEPEEMEPINV